MNKNQRSSFKHWFVTKYLPSLRSSSSDKGYILITAISIVLGISGLMLLYGKSNMTERSTAVATVDSNSGFYAAEAALNERANDLREIFLSYNRPTGTSPSGIDACFQGGGNQGSGSYECVTTTYTGAGENRSGFRATSYVLEQNGGQVINGQVPQGDEFGGLNMQEYRHSIYALSFKDSNVDSVQGKQPNAVLQMDVSSRIIPMFQFTAFFGPDLEILPGPRMLLSGPIHTNNNLYLGANNRLTINARVSAVKEIYNHRKENNSTYPDGRVRIANSQGTLLNLLSNGVGNTTPTTARMEPSLLRQNWGPLVASNTNDEIKLPPAGFLGSTGAYFLQADIQIEFTPAATSNNFNYLDTIPFALTAINQTVSPSVTTTFNNDQLRSLRQPVMVNADLASISVSPINSPITNSTNPLINIYGDDGEWLPNRNNYNICTPDTSIDNPDAQLWWDSLTRVQKNNLRPILQTVIQQQIQKTTRPVLLSHLNKPINSFDGGFSYFSNNLFYDTIDTSLFAGLGFTINEDRLRELTPNEIAGLPVYTGSGTGTVVSGTSRCFVAAPIMEVGRDDSGHQSSYRFYNQREGRDMRVLQMNAMSMAIWNRDGQYWNSTTNTLISSDSLLYAKAPADTTAPANSFQRLGLAALDDTDGGMVIHANLNRANYPYTDKKSPYAFAVVQAHQLFGLGRSTQVQDPTGVTFASPQSFYVQGDFNTTNYQPASILTDAFAPLSKACITDDMTIHKDGGKNCNTSTSSLNKTDAVDTAFNGGLLSGTDVTIGTQYSGGLENYPRFLENWSNKEWRYRGSFISLDLPTHSDGRWGQANVYNAPNRNWDYDSNYNNVANLPPLSPTIVVIKQESFTRNFEE